jgi:hypothetical protein
MAMIHHFLTRHAQRKLKKSPLSGIGVYEKKLSFCNNEPV